MVRSEKISNSRGPESGARAGLGALERHLGDYCVLLNGLGRFQNALGRSRSLQSANHSFFNDFGRFLGGEAINAPWGGADPGTP